MKTDIHNGINTWDEIVIPKQIYLPYPTNRIHRPLLVRAKAIAAIKLALLGFRLQGDTGITIFDDRLGRSVCPETRLTLVLLWTWIAENDCCRFMSVQENHWPRTLNPDITNQNTYYREILDIFEPPDTIEVYSLSNIADLMIYYGVCELVTEENETVLQMIEVLEQANVSP